MAGKLDGKSIFVTGGGSGIGRATAFALAREGAKLMIADYVPEGAERVVKEIKGNGGAAAFVHADISVNAQVEMAVNKTVETYGRIDGAFNNAGIEGKVADTVLCSEEIFDRTIAINLKGVWLCMKAELQHMLKQGGGNIVNTASVAGLRGFVGLGLQCLEAWRDRTHADRRPGIRDEEYPRQLRMPRRDPYAHGRAHARYQQYRRGPTRRDGTGRAHGQAGRDRGRRGLAAIGCLVVRHRASAGD